MMTSSLSRLPFFGLAFLLAVRPTQAADLPADKGNEIPASALRPVVITLDKRTVTSDPPKADLPDGFELITAAAAPLVTHPIMGCLDDRGRLFVGDAVGVNWSKAQLEANPPNRILLLEDADKDGAFDKSTIFADRMTFPQGGCWLDGSLYVCSPPGLWKLTDTDQDGVADRREMIVSGFDYTGNAADVHGPKLHPNGRLYWCHGRKGHKVVGQDGIVAHEGLASGIWSCRPDGRDVRWHSLGCADNPTGIDFTPEGDVIGTCNLYYSNPRGDTLMHWLYGGVYERRDMMKAIDGQPRTLETMPVMHNFGHVAVSGCTFWRGSPFPGLQMLVTHFNTQRIVRMELTRDGATYKAHENEFLKLHQPDIHLTDVLEDRDGSLLAIDTGGWFRIGCPSSLMAKSDILGAVYRIRSKNAAAPRPQIAESKPMPAPDTQRLATALASEDLHVRLHACEAIAKAGLHEPAVRAALLKLLEQPMDPPLEHAALVAFRAAGGATPEMIETAKQSTLLRRLLLSASIPAGPASLRAAIQHLDAADADLAATAVWIVTRQSLDAAALSPVLQRWLREPPTDRRRAALERVLGAFLTDSSIKAVVTTMLTGNDASFRNLALRVLANQTAANIDEAWLPPLEKALAEANGDLPLLLDALKKLKHDRFQNGLQTIADDAQRPLPVRLKALDAMKGGKITPATFDLLYSVLTGANSSTAARIQAATMLAAAPLDKTQTTKLAPALASAGPIELKELLGLCRKTKDAEIAKVLAIELAKNSSLISQQESIYRTTFSSHPPEIFETIVLPALRQGNEALEAKKRILPSLAEKATANGDATRGHAVFAAGKGTCIACHKIASEGRPIGPDLSKIGGIRTERDLIESILFPSNTLARDYEAHIIETSDGQSTIGVIKSHTAEGLLVQDVAGQEKSIPHATITGNTTLTTSLMPMGLDQTMPEQELLDLVAYLRSLK